MMCSVWASVIAFGCDWKISELEMTLDPWDVNLKANWIQSMSQDNYVESCQIIPQRIGVFVWENLLDCCVHVFCRFNHFYF